jgi:hypothetical protein
MQNATQTERAPLVKIVGTVADIILAPAPNKPGKIELESGKMLHAFADKLQMVRKGEAYDFGCEPTEFRGVLNHTVRAVRAAGGSDKPGPAPANYVTTEEVLAQRRPQPDPINYTQRPGTRTEGMEFHEPRTAAQPKPQTNNGNGYKGWTPEDRKSAFRCALMTAAVTARVVNPFDRNDIARATIEIDAGYDLAEQHRIEQDHQG